MDIQILTPTLLNQLLHFIGNIRRRDFWAFTALQRHHDLGVDFSETIFFKSTLNSDCEKSFIVISSVDFLTTVS